MILLDTNVVSQAMKPDGDMAVCAWLDAQPKTDLYLCAPVLAELRYGAVNLPNGKKKDFLLAACDHIENKSFAGRILTFDRFAAHFYAEFRAKRRREGRSIAEMDMAIAAIASAHAMTLATRNVCDFEGLGIPLVDPFAV